MIAMNQKNDFVLLLAGNGTRIYSDIHMKKQFYPLLGKELFLYPLETALESGFFSSVVLVVDSEDISTVRAIVEQKIKTEISITYVAGGRDRNESVFHGLKSLLPDSEDEVVYIHDAARVLLSRDLLFRLNQAMKDHDALTAAIPVHDSLLRETEIGIEYIPRDGMFQIQTPQVFRLRKILSIYEKGYDSNDTDDFRKAVKANLSCAVVRGESDLFKVTEIDDLRLLESILRGKE